MTQPSQKIQPGIPVITNAGHEATLIPIQNSLGIHLGIVQTDSHIFVCSWNEWGVASEIRDISNSVKHVDDQLKKDLSIQNVEGYRAVTKHFTIFSDGSTSPGYDTKETARRFAEEDSPRKPVATTKATLVYQE